jgi:parallel beta-helix repeat protein
MPFNANTDWFFKSVHYIDVPMFSILTNYILRFGSHLNFIMFAGELFFLQYLFVLPLVPFGFWNDRFLSPFLVLTAIGSFLPLLTPTYGIPDWDRWMFMLVYPFTIYATNAISKLISYGTKRKASNSKQNKTLRFHKAFVRKLLAGAYVLFIAVFGVNYVLGNLSSFYNPILGYIPTSMSHKPLSSQEAQDIIANIKWLNTLNNNHNNASSVDTPSQTQEESSFCLVCEDKDHGFIRLYLNEDIQIVVFYTNLDAALSFAKSKSYSRIFMLLQTEPYIHEFEVVNRMHYYSLYTMEKIPTFTTISIRADGLVDPPTAPMKRDGDTYILTSSINSDADGIVVQRDNIVLDGAAHRLHGKGNGTGIDLSERKNVTLRDMQIEAFYMGIKLSSSFYDTIIENAILKNSNGIYTYDSSNNTMARNNITDNWGGIYVYISSNNNSVMENSVENNNGGIYLWSSLNNLIYGNTIETNDDYGVCLDESSNSSISGNRIEGNGAGLWVKPASSGNVIYHNYFKSNKVHVLTENSTNAWDNGYPAGGNYWSDYVVGDLNFDGIGDHPFLIDANNTDRYPLMGVYYGFHITSEQSVSAISNSTIFNLTFDNENRVMSFNVNGNGGQGFCMLMIPKSLMNGPLTVIIDGKATNATELPFSDSAHTYLYFTYIQGTHRITIVPKTGVS